MGDFAHVPVMLEECLAALAIKPGGIYLDGTAGGGGHSAAIAKQLGAGRLYAMDRDPDAIAAAGAALSGLPAEVLQADFRDAAATLRALGVAGLDGALLDLGVSSHQLDSAARGFSYHGDAPLDMRMSRSGQTAADVVNTASREELTRVFRDYGEESYAWQIAGKIVKAREAAPLETTGQLAELVSSAVPPAVRRKQKNPARKVFMALRIHVNGEFDALEAGLRDVFDLLKPGGRFAVITFHSLEDRIVKQKFRALTTRCICPPELPVCVCGGKAKAAYVGKNPIVPTERELEENRRARSAKLRAVEKL